MDGPVEENFEALSIDERLSHKSWKARVSGYTALIKSFKQTVSESDPIFKNYVNNPVGTLKEWVRDSNAVSQEKGVETVAALIEFGGRQAAKARPDVMPSIVEKCLGSARSQTKTKAIEVCLLFVEVEEDQGEGVIADLSPGLDVKQPKVVAGVVTALREIVRQYGAKSIAVKSILRLLPKIFSHADKTVRSEGTLLALALHSYLGPALTPHLSELKPVQVKELTEAFEEADKKGEGLGNVKATRFTRSQQRERQIKEAEGALEGKGGADEIEEAESTPDPFDFVEPVEVLSVLPEDFYTNLSSSNWKARKELALEPLLSLIKVPRIKSGNYSELLGALAGRMGDANVVCVTLAANCIEALALGLREEFGKYREVITGPVLARTKEKKASVLDALGAALDAIYLSVSIGDITTEVVTYSKDKNPSVKAETIKWYIRCLKLTLSPPPKSDLQPITEVLLKALGDSGEPVRLAAAEGLGTLMKVFGGERAFGGQFEGLDDLRKAKVMEAFESAIVKVKAGAAPSRAAVVEAPAPMKLKPKPKAPPAAVVKERPPMVFDDVDEFSAPPQSKAPPPRTAPVSRPPIKRPPVASTSSAPPAKKIAPPPATASSSKSAPSKPSEPLKYKYNQEDAEFQAEGILPPAVFPGLSDGNWKVRLGAMESLHSWLSGGEMENVESELIVRYLSKKPGWKESNFQVSAKMFGIFQLLADESPLFSKASIALATPGLSDKLGDIKLKKPAGDAMTAFAEKSSLQFVLSQAYEPMTKQKAPKAQADAMVWVDQAIRDFGIGGLAVREMIDFLKVGLKSTNAAVRTSATKTLVTVKLFVGADISTFLQDLNPALLTTIESEFAKVSGDLPPEPTRTASDSVVISIAGGKSSGGGGGDALDDLYPRVDLEKLISSAVVNSVNDANWKTRKESLETIQSILEANKRLKPSNLSDLTTALKLRLADSNKIVQVLALDVVARIATGMGKAFDKHGRIFSGPVAAVLADQKANIRAAGITTLTAIADASGLESLLSTFEKPLDTQNPLLRKELLSWLETRFSDEEVLATLDLSSITVAVLSCLEDRNTDVRKAAIALLPTIVSRAGFSYVMDQTSKLKPASRSTVVPLIENARGSTSTSGPPARALPPSKTSSAATKSLRTNVPSASSSIEEVPISRASSIRPATSAIRGKIPASSSSRASPVPAPATPTVKEPPFKISDLQPKSMRSSKETGSLRWVVEHLPRPDQVEALFQQMTPVTSSELLVQLFSTDHNSERDFAAGLTTLIDCAKDLGSAQNYDISSDEMRARLLANLDIIFKYITLRIGLPSTTITVKCLDLVEALLTLSDGDGYKLSDYETTPLLISLIGKVGDGKETIRQRVRGIFRSLCDVYPSSRIFTTILEHGLTSKNARTRTESADELGSLFKRHGTSTFSLPKALPALAKLISDRDASVRTAALTAIGSAYTIVGAEVIYKHIGSIPDKERTMLEERLKRTQGGAPASPIPSSNPSRSATPSRGDSLPHPASPSGTPRPLSMMGSKVPAKGIPGIGLARTSAPPATTEEAESKSSPPSRVPAIRGIPRPSSTIGLPARSIPTSRSSEITSPHVASTSTTGLIQSIVVDDTAKSTEALKQVQQLIATRPESLLRNADELIEALVRKMSVAFSGLDSDTSLPLLRLCKHIMQTLSHFFDNKSLGQSVSSDALTILLAELAGRLLDTAENQASEAIASLSKVLNMVLIRIFHHANQTACFTALFAVLQDATIDLRELQGNELTDRAKYAELVMKCLWKVSKTVKESLISDSLSASRLLKDINGFLVAIPPGEWRRRVSDAVPLADMPLRTVKTILQQIVSVYADDVYDELDEVDKASTSFVYQYLLRLVANNATTRPAVVDSPARPGQSRTSSTASGIDQVQVPASPRVSNGGSSRGGPSPDNAASGDIEMNQQLKVIFDTIGDPGRSREGIAALYQFQKAHPEAAARISTWMSKTGNYFQTYLKRALDNLATADQEKSGFESPAISPAPSRAPSTTRIPPAATTPVKETPVAVPRVSIGSAQGALNSPSAKLLDLQNMFGFTSTETGRM